MTNWRKEDDIRILEQSKLAIFHKHIKMTFDKKLIADFRKIPRQYSKKLILPKIARKYRRNVYKIKLLRKSEYDSSIFNSR
jgi:hypothetical protein